MIAWVALALGLLIAAELAALVTRRAWVHWKRGRRALLVDDAITTLAETLVTGAEPEQPQGRVRRRAFRLATLELLSVLVGDSRERLTRIADELGLVDDAVRTLRRSPRAYARRTAADELAELRSARAAPALAVALADLDPIVRVAAARGLASLPDLDRIDRIQQVLDHDSRRAPGAAISAMLALASAAPEALAELERSGRSPFARRLAALALATVGDERAIPSLLGELASDNALLSSLALRAIERIGGGEAIGSLEGVIADAGRDLALRDQAERALGRIQAAGGPR